MLLCFISDRINKRKNKEKESDETEFSTFCETFNKEEIEEAIYEFDSTHGGGKVSVVLDSPTKFGKDEHIFKFNDNYYLDKCNDYFTNICRKLKGLYWKDYLICHLFDVNRDWPHWMRGCVWFKRFNDIESLLNQLVDDTTNYFIISESDSHFYRFKSYKCKNIKVSCPYNEGNFVDVLIERYTKNGDFYILGEKKNNKGLSEFMFIRKNFSKD